MPKSANEPSRRLAGFDRVTLRPGASVTVHLVLNPAGIDHPLSIWDITNHSWQIPAGRFRVQVGPSVSKTALIGSFTVQ